MSFSAGKVLIKHTYSSLCLTELKVLISLQGEFKLIFLYFCLFSLSSFISILTNLLICKIAIEKV